MALPGHQPDERTAHPARGPDAITLRQPRSEDATAIHRLIAACPPLDTNSLYCNLLQASHFAECCILAEAGGRIVGWISGYRPPSDPSTLFIWQVAVDRSARGHGLARRMLDGLLARRGLSDVRTVTTTITPTNQASWALFRGFAHARGAGLNDQVHFEQDRHFGGGHETEHLVTIGLPPPLRATA